MIYNFLLVPRDPGQSWRELLDANEQRVLKEGDRPLSPAAWLLAGSFSTAGKRR
jgi:hypothetical protein